MGRTYVPMSDPIWDTVSHVLKQSFPNMCICWIEKNNNPELQHKYLEQKASLLLKRGEANICEKQLFHGTKHYSVHNICQNGFNIDMNRTSMYGKGTYFSTSAQMSSGYTDKASNEMSYIIVCNVLIGTCKIGTVKEVLNTELYDNTVNTLENPTIITTPYNYGAFPEYVVAYYKNAV